VFAFIFDLIIFKTKFYYVTLIGILALLVFFTSKLIVAFSCYKKKSDDDKENDT